MSNTPRTDAVCACAVGRKLETELAEARQQLVEQAALVERMRHAIGGLLTYFGMDKDLAKELIALPPSTALAEHDAEVRRKALEEAADDVDREMQLYAGADIADFIRRMAKGE